MAHIVVFVDFALTRTYLFRDYNIPARGLNDKYVYR